VELLELHIYTKIAGTASYTSTKNGDNHISMTGVRRTPGYVAPEVCDTDIGPEIERRRRSGCRKRGQGKKKEKWMKKLREMVHSVQLRRLVQM
jgi:hypothetical protein